MVNLYYIRQGSGFPLILLHGNGEDSSYFSHQTEAFSARFQTYAIDTRGHGRSPRGKAPFTLIQFAQDLKNFMDEHNIPKAHILGFSDGGNIAMLFAQMYPERVEKLILNGANLDPQGVKPLVQLPIVLGYGLLSFISLFDKGAIPKKELLCLMVTQPHIKPHQLSSLHIPTLVVAGDRDMIKDSHTRLIAESIPDAQLCILPGSHFVAAENPKAFNRAVLEFLEQ
ncbi:MAG: alpha/beta hydrolase [Oscillospiraceae bacterium]|nr:alpha/beta hydrolase [Oscillospiraceae bacterium]